MTQQARQMVWGLEERDFPVRFLIRDNDGKYTETFDTVFRSEGLTVIHTPFQAPVANACAERWVWTVREECLNKVLIINQSQLRQVTTFFCTCDPRRGS